jgi:hypothetical protein
MGSSRDDRIGLGRICTTHGNDQRQRSTTTTTTTFARELTIPASAKSGTVPDFDGLTIDATARRLRRDPRPSSSTAVLAAISANERSDRSGGSGGMPRGYT